MTKSEITELLNENYNSFIYYLNGLTIEDYSFSHEYKWSAGQQLAHIVLCVKPIVQVFGMDTQTIKQNFGLSNGISRSYETLLDEYLKKLKEGGKAPERYVPEPLIDSKGILIEALTDMLKSLCLKINSFTEEELDILSIPHPLLGKLTLREMLYNVIYHVEHHHQLTEQNIQRKYL
ncbi:MAG: DinB family protein [Bacteroidia bacterium]